jgi:hypothetical protein
MKIHIEGSRATRPASQRTIYCDGSTDQPFREDRDIELSHWIPNRTPLRYKADSSTEIALNFAAHAQRAGDFDLVVNNHVDVDGLLALYVLVQGKAALTHRRTLVQAAEMGDFWAWGDAPAQALFDGLTTWLGTQSEAIERATEVAERGLAQIHALLNGEAGEPDSAGLSALRRSVALIDTGEILRRQVASRLTHYVIPARLAEHDLAHALAVPTSSAGLRAPTLLLPHARARHDEQRLQLISVETAAGWHYDLWLPGYAWAETPRRWPIPGLAADGHAFQHDGLHRAVRQLAAAERLPGEWQLAGRISFFGTLPGRGFPVLLSFMDRGTSARSSLKPSFVEDRIAEALEGMQ